MIDSATVQYRKLWSRDDVVYARWLTDDDRARMAENARRASLIALQSQYVGRVANWGFGQSV